MNDVIIASYTYALPTTIPMCSPPNASSLIGLALFYSVNYDLHHS